MDDLNRFCCQNEDCRKYGQRDQGNLSVCGHYGCEGQHRLLYCKTCKARFSARKGTPLFDSRLPHDTIIAVLHHLAEGCGIRKTARLTSVHRDTVTRFARRAGEHARQLHDELVGFSPQHPKAAAR